MRFRIVPIPIATDETATMPQHADFIVIGAGSAGCVVARLLAERGFRVMLVEAGPSAAINRSPANYLRTFGSSDDWDFETVPQAGLAQRKIRWPRGRGPGGCTRINASIWYPPQASDLAQLDLAGGPAWSSDLLLQSLRQIGDWVCPESPRWISEATRRFLIAANRSGHPFQAFLRMTRRGLRRTAADLLEESPSYSAVRMVTAEVQRICFTGTRATGIELLGGGEHHPETIVADIAVILSAGTIGSPTVLVRSGVGPLEALQQSGYDPVQAIEQVGANLSDHLIMPIIFATSPQHRFPTATDGHGLARLAVSGSGPLASNLAEAGGLFGLSQPSTATSANDAGGAGAARAPRSLGHGTPSAQIHVTPTHYLLHPDARAPAAMTLGVNLCDPSSRGQLTFAPPTGGRNARVEIDPGYLSSADDRQQVLLAIRFARDLAQQSPLASFCREELVPGIRRQTDEAITRCVERYAQTLYHPVGTCRMGLDRDCVVNERLAVRGLSGLHIVDASVLPGLPSVNPNATVMMLAMHAAKMIAESSS